MENNNEESTPQKIETPTTENTQPVTEDTKTVNTPAAKPVHKTTTAKTAATKPATSKTTATRTATPKTTATTPVKLAFERIKLRYT